MEARFLEESDLGAWERGFEVDSPPEQEVPATKVWSPYGHAQGRFKYLVAAPPPFYWAVDIDINMNF